jgi:HK97 family phage major capsid protein
MPRRPANDASAVWADWPGVLAAVKGNLVVARVAAIQAEASRRVVSARARLSRPTNPAPRAPAAHAGNPQPMKEHTMPQQQWQHAGEFYRAVYVAGARAASVMIGEPDERLISAAAPNPSQEGNGADGGYLAPPDVRADVARLVLGEESLLGRTTRVTTNRNAVALPADALPPWATTGVLATPEGEGQLLAQTKAAVQGREVRLHKVQVLVPVTNELLEDAPALGAYLRATAPIRLQFKVDDWLLNGDGVAKPFGIVQSGAKIVQTKEGSQTAATINLANTQKMLTRLHAAARPNAVWLAHPETEPQLSGLGLPHWNPAGPTPLLHGLPVLFREACAPLGAEGDLLLVDLSAYFSAMRDPAIREDLSVHCWFDYEVSAFRFTFRVGGMPFWSAPVTRFKTGTTISTFVTLETRS